MARKKLSENGQLKLRDIELVCMDSLGIGRDSLVSEQLSETKKCVRKPFLERLKPSLRLLQIFLHYSRGIDGSDWSWVGVVVGICTLLGVVINAVLFGYTVRIILIYHRNFGLLHAATIATVITGIKPFINITNMSIFVLTLRRHRRLLRTMDSLDETFFRHFGNQIPIGTYNCWFVGAMAMSFLVPMCLRIVEFHVMNEKLGRFWLSDVSLVVVPFLTAWNLLPLYYYDIMNRIVRRWSKMLRREIQETEWLARRDQTSPRRSLRFYYQQFLKLVRVQEAMGDVFNPFVLASLGWSVFILCLTIYFITQANPSVMDNPRLHNYPNKRETWRTLMLFNIGWSTLQIIVAVIVISVVCITGTATNESTRKIIKTILSVAHEKTSETDRFQVTCFIHQMQTQYAWGMSVWRAFPLERGFFFTLVSLIITYAFLLLKLRNKDELTTSQKTKPLEMNLTTILLDASVSHLFNSTDPPFNISLRSI